MKAMKKWIAAALLACLILCGCSAVADTEITVDSEEKTATTSVVLDLGEQPTSYIVVIPSTVTLDPATGKGSAAVTLKSGFVLTDVTSLKVRMTGGFSEAVVGALVNGSVNIIPAYMNLTNTEDGSQLKCEITSSELGNIMPGSLLISVTNETPNTEDQACTLDFSVTETLPAYGKYVGTLTFSITTSNE